MPVGFWGDVLECYRLDRRYQRARLLVSYLPQSLHPLHLSWWFVVSSLRLLYWLAHLALPWVFPLFIVDWPSASQSDHPGTGIFLVLWVVWIAQSIDTRATTWTPFELLRMPSREALWTARWLRALPRLGWLSTALVVGLAIAAARRAEPGNVLPLASFPALALTPFWFAAWSADSRPPRARASRRWLLYLEQAVAIGWIGWVAWVVLVAVAQVPAARLPDVGAVPGLALAFIVVALGGHLWRQWRDRAVIEATFGDSDDEDSASVSARRRAKGRSWRARIARRLGPKAPRSHVQAMRFYEFHGTSWWKEGFFRALAIFAGWLAVADSSPEGMRPALVFLAALAALALGEGQSAAHRLYLWGVDLRDQELRRLRRSLLSGAMAIVAAALALVPVGAGAAPLAALASVGGGVLLVAGWRGIFGDGCVTLLVGSTAGALALVATLHGYRVPLPAVLGAASAAAILGSIGLAAQCFALDEAHLRREMGKAGG